ncbi:hypothetical protein VNI00_015511 [Paramarasmius palmivorus]|uniref:Uncharacterized protein n=1 Tax=Paramarasmius palmivorus TaxID=297713 RepID=A0AAW0BKD4_9AGAR
MSNVHDIESDSDSGSPFRWNIDKLCAAANHLRLAPDYTTYTCEPAIFRQMASPLPPYQPDHEWYILFTTTVQEHLQPGIYRDVRAIQTQFPKGTPPGEVCILRYADSLEDARGIWNKQCVKHHREEPMHQDCQEALDDQAYSVASQAKAALVHKELLDAYPQLRPRRRRRAEHLAIVENTSISAGPAVPPTAPSASTAGSGTANVSHDVPNVPDLNSWNLYVVHANGLRRHVSL